MVRKDNHGVDFGIWKNIKPSQLIIPLGCACSTGSKACQLLNRKQTDWLSAVELTNELKKLDTNDPSKYDFAFFALGVLEKF